MTGPNIEVTIDELALHGFSPSAGSTIGDAVQAELTRLLGDRGLPASLRSIADFRATSGTQLSNEPPRRAGYAIAKAVYDGMGRTER